MEAAAIWPATERDGANPFFDNILGNSEIYEENSKLMFTDDGFIDIEACVLDALGMLLILQAEGVYQADLAEKDAKPRSCATWRNCRFICMCCLSVHVAS